MILDDVQDWLDNDNDHAIVTILNDPDHGLLSIASVERIKDLPSPARQACLSASPTMRAWFASSGTREIRRMLG